MKQKDILVIVIVVIVSAVVAYIVSNKFITTPSDRQQQVEVVGQINPDFQKPSSQYFNSQSIDPTQLIQIGNNSNQSPFGSGTSGQ